MKKIRNKKNRGFTLIEVIVAVSIVIILSALAVPKVSGYISRAKETKAMSMGKQIYNAAMWSYSEQGNTFNSDKIKAAVADTTNITLADTDVDTAGSDVVIKFSNDSKNYTLSINKTSSNYTITNTTDSKAVFSSTS